LEWDGNVIAMARVARVHRAEVYKCLKRYGVSLPPRPVSHSGRRVNWGRLQ
jgi:hypothetical protein